METVIRIEGIDDMVAAVAQLGPGYVNHLLGPALGAAGVPVRRAASKKNFGFTDRTGRLRKTIRRVRISWRYGGRRYKRGRAAVFAGAKGSRQAYLVEAGHGGPFPAKPHPYMAPAFLMTTHEQFDAFKESVQRRFRFTTRLYVRRRSAAPRPKYQR